VHRLNTRLAKVIAFAVLGVALAGIALGAYYLHEDTWERVEVPTHSIASHSLGLHQQGDEVSARVMIDEGSVSVLEGRRVTVQLVDSDNRASMEQGEGYSPVAEIRIDVRESSLPMLLSASEADGAQIIAELEPRPARRFQTEEPRYIVPDVYVHRVGDEYYVVANDDGMPKLKISGFYRSAMADNPKAKEYIQDKLRSAQWLIRSIDQRRKTIVKVTECIVDKQRDFFDKGIEHLKPMILRDVAETVGMHESTISRVTSNKYVHTPRGTFELKYFFNSAIKRDHHTDIASESVKQAIKSIISGEDPKAPLSDQRIVEILGEDDIKIARRTVAKYREMLGILSSSKRKKYF